MANQTQNQEEPPGHRDENGPIARPEIVCPDNREAGDKHEYAGQIDNRRDLAVVQMRLNERKLRDERSHEGGAEKRCNVSRVGQDGLRSLRRPTPELSRAAKRRRLDELSGRSQRTNHDVIAVGIPQCKFPGARVGIDARLFFKRRDESTRSL